MEMIIKDNNQYAKIILTEKEKKDITNAIKINKNYHSNIMLTINENKNGINLIDNRIIINLYNDIKIEKKLKLTLIYKGYLIMQNYIKFKDFMELMMDIEGFNYSIIDVFYTEVQKEALNKNEGDY